MLGIFLAFVAAAAAVLICLNADTLGRRLGVMDHPDNDRKNHIKATPLVGGIGILLPLLIWLTGALLSGVGGDSGTLTVLMIGAAGVGLIGFADDQTPITALSRILLVLVFLGVAFVVAPELIAKGLNWGSFEPTPLPGWAYCALLAVTTIGIVNAVNMADGQNGVVPSMFVVWSLCLMLVGDSVVSQVAQILAVVSFVVLMFNVQGRLFLGDCGSYGVTFVLGLLALIAYVQGRLTIETITVWFFIPVMDCLRLIITRRLEGRSPAAPDKNHFHHRLQSKLGTTYGLVAYIASVGATSFIAALVPQFALVCIIVLTAIYFSFAFLTDSATARATYAKDAESSDLDESFTNVVSIALSELSKRAGGP
jgi:UDP-GlcNAc:undecaprenyl-phosphate GlcNAc-1-phosphate transferase